MNERVGPNHNSYVVRGMQYRFKGFNLLEHKEKEIVKLHIKDQY